LGKSKECRKIEKGKENENEAIQKEGKTKGKKAETEAEV
jgi:hypothetical protein